MRDVDSIIVGILGLIAIAAVSGGMIGLIIRIARYVGGI